MKITSPPLLISIIFIIVGILLNTWLIQSTKVYKATKEELANTLSYKKRFLDEKEWQLKNESKSGDFSFETDRIKIVLPFGSSEELDKQYQQLNEKIQQAQQTTQTRTFYILLLIALYLLIMGGIYFKAKPTFLALCTLIAVSIVCLHAGLFTPMLEIGAVERDLNLGEIPIQKEIMGINVDLTVQKKFEGDIFFYYQSKSVIELITLLFQQNNLLVGISILIFSVLFPFIKTLLLIAFLFNPQIKKQKWFSNFVLNLSKWSMADVFVVAMFLGFLAFENMQAGVNTYSDICVGLYFFLAYCLLSIFSSMLAKLPTEEGFQSKTTA